MGSTNEQKTTYKKTNEEKAKKCFKNNYNSPENQYIYIRFFLYLYLLGPIVFSKKINKLSQVME